MIGANGGTEDYRLGWEVLRRDWPILLLLAVSLAAGPGPHRAAARAWVAAGLVGLAGAAAGPAAGFAILMAALGAAVVYSFVYSYVLFRRERAGR